MVASSLLTARKAYVDALATIKGLAVSVHGGVFDTREIQLYSKRAPAAVITSLGYDVISLQGTPEVSAKWGVVVFCVDAPATEKGAAVVSLVEQCVMTLSNTFASGGGASGRPSNMTAQNLFADALDRTGVALWKIEWDQRLELVDQLDDDDDTASLKLIDAIWDLSPRDHDAELGEVPDAHDTIVLDGDDS